MSCVQRLFQYATIKLDPTQLPIYQKMFLLPEIPHFAGL